MANTQVKSVSEIIKEEVSRGRYSIRGVAHGVQICSLEDGTRGNYHFFLEEGNLSIRCEDIFLRHISHNIEALSMLKASSETGKEVVVTGQLEGIFPHYTLIEISTIDYGEHSGVLRREISQEGEK
ncbi:MAG: hypothetical protein ABIH25_02905 [Candidatus Woesearchaeota archaeon]